MLGLQAQTTISGSCDAGIKLSALYIVGKHSTRRATSKPSRPSYHQHEQIIFSLNHKYQHSSILVTSMSGRLDTLQKQLKGRKVYFRLQFERGNHGEFHQQLEGIPESREPGTLRGTHFLRGSITSPNVLAGDQVFKRTSEPYISDSIYDCMKGVS